MPSSRNICLKDDIDDCHPILSEASPPVCLPIAFQNPAIQAELQQLDPDDHDSDVDTE